MGDEQAGRPGRRKLGRASAGRTFVLPGVGDPRLWARLQLAGSPFSFLFGNRRLLARHASAQLQPRRAQSPRPTRGEGRGEAAAVWAAGVLVP